MNQLPTDGKPLIREIGIVVVDSGTRVGESDPVKDTFWSAFEFEGQNYVSLNDDPACVWLCTREQLEKDYGINFEN